MPKSADVVLERRIQSLDADQCVAEFAAEGKRLAGRKEFRAALEQAKLLSDENRLLALSLLKHKGTRCACEIQAALGVSHDTVSHHMDQLTRGGLVAAERRGKWMYYTLTEDVQGRVP